MHGSLRRVGNRLVTLVGVVALSSAGAAFVFPSSAAAAPAEPTSHDAVVSDVPAGWTPQIRDGRVFDIAQMGDTVVAGGRFDEVAASDGSGVRPRDNIVAFSAPSGQINDGFDPVIGGDVTAVEPGPSPGTVYVGGTFSGIDGTTGKLFLLDASTGQIESSFSAPNLNGAVQDMVRVGDRLLVAGTFRAAFDPNGHARRGVMSVDAETGQLDDFLTVDLEGHHNWSEGSGRAKGPVGPRAMAVSPDGVTLALIGNFTEADGYARDQVTLVDLEGSQAEVIADWKTSGYEATCASGAFDTYVRDVSFAPDGSYFSIAATGGPFPGTLCDALTRWETASRGADVGPAWVDETGGDTLLSVVSSGEAVYTGGHQRWLNNDDGRDRAMPGAVPRPGIGAVDPRNGVPVSWNPGRNPRGVGAAGLTVTPAGLWVGQDTSWIGNFRYRRPGIAFFPASDGADITDPAARSLPARVFQQVDGQSGEVFARINSGGPALPASDGGPSWLADTDTDSQYRNSGSNAAGWPSGATPDGSVPGTTPAAVFDSERWDPSGDPEMSWSIPVPEGEEVSVRLYLANRCTCTDAAGERVFDVSVEGEPVLDDYDIVADVGDDVGTMKSVDLTSDGVISIDFGHVTENPLVNAIEVVSTADTPDASPAGLSSFWYEGDEVTSTAEQVDAGGLDWATVRGATLIGDELFYGSSDGEFYRRSFDGSTLGSATAIDPYNDPEWADVDTGSGQTYRGVRPSWYAEISKVTGMTYADGALYYTLFGSDKIHVRGFSPDSGIVTADSKTVPGFTSPNLAGLFLDAGNDNLYFGNSATGELSRVDWSDGGVSGSPQVLSGPDVDGHDWTSRALFPGPGGPPPPPNEVPQAVFTRSADGLDGGFDASESSDPDGQIASYEWEFGDGESGTGVTVEHTYAEAGTYTVTLTVTDDDGARTMVSQDVTVTEANVAPEAALTSSSSGLTAAFDGGDSQDPDGEIASYEWKFGDGESGTGVTVEHTYAGAGTYTVTLTVTDDDGATASATEDVTVEAPNAPPEASFTVSADGLTAALDASESSDADGEVATYAWEFGDGKSGTGVTVEHTYAEAGTYTVTLTVTDDDGATGSATRDVTIANADVSSPAYVDHTAWNGHTRSTARVQLSDSVRQGDLLLAYVTLSGPRDIDGPVGVGGWDDVATESNGPQNVLVYSRTANGAEAGKTVSFDFGQWTKADVTVMVYRGVAADPVEAVATDTSTGTENHPSPEVEVLGNHRLAVSYWSDRSSSTTGWTAPDGVSVRSTQVGAGGGRVSSLVADGVADAGMYGGLVARTTPSSPRSAAVTLALAPGDSPPPPNQAPEGRITFPPCQELSCSFDGEGSSDPDGQIASYEWDFGDGGTGTGASVDHTFAEAGTYTVALTLTDDDGASSVVTRDVTVSDTPSTAPAFVDSAAVNGHGQSVSTQIPESVGAGDLMLTFVTLSGPRDLDGPEGVGAWDEVTTAANGPQQVQVYSRVADGSEGGEVVSMDLGTWTKVDVTIMVYRGIADDPVEAVADATSTDSVEHVSPAVEVTGPGRRLITHWSDRSSSTTDWSAPLGVNVRSTQVGAGGGRVSSLVVDDRADAGRYGGLTARTTPESPRSVALTIALAPAGEE